MQRYKAPGKLMIMGEHAVVYGYPCIVSALNRYISVSATVTHQSTYEIHAPQVNNTSYIESCIAFAHKQWGIPLSVSITVEDAFPSTYGFGSSAAVTAATLSALASVNNIKSINNHDLFTVAYAVIKHVQGNGSGFDVASAIYGGTIWYNQLGKEIKSVSLVSPDIAWIVGYTGIKADTVTLVNHVAQMKKTHPENIVSIFEAIGSLVEKAVHSIQDTQWEKLGALLTENQEYLRKLNVSSDRIERLIDAALHGGAYGAKLSGAGGGDCIIALGPRNKKESIEQAIRLAGGEVVTVELQAEGVLSY